MQTEPSKRPSGRNGNCCRQWATGIVSLHITPEVVDPDDTEMLEDLVVAAINEALQQSQELMSSEMSKLTGGLKIPGLP